VDELAQTRGDTVVDQLRSLLLDEGVNRAGEIVLYTSFGVVRGRLAPSFVRQLTDQPPDGPLSAPEPAKPQVAKPQMVEIYDATVEHYSSHLPTGSFSSLYVRLADVSGIAFEALAAQG
jgi:hypothetical protein